jgi:hypothetical protein
MFKTKFMANAITSTIITIMIVGYILIHLPYITHLDYTTTLHEWRQSDVLGVARNYYNESMNFFYPRIDGRRNLSGITGMEFPLFNYILALLYTISGKIIPLYGKMMSFGCALGSVWLMFKITIIDNFCKKWPTYPIVILFFAFCNHYFFLFSFTIMPEFLALFLSLFGFWKFQKYKQNNKNHNLFISCLCFCLGMLVRPYFAFFGITMLIYCFSQLRAHPKECIKIFITGILTLIPFSIWYGYWVPHLDKTYGIKYFYMGTPLKQNIDQIISSSNLAKGTLKLLSESYSLPALIPLIILGFILLIIYYKKTRSIKKLIHSPIFQCLLAGIVAIITIPVLIGNSVVSDHQYYLGAAFPILVILPSICISYLLNLTKSISKPMYTTSIIAFIILASAYFGIITLESTITRKLPDHPTPKWHNIQNLIKEKPALLKGVNENDLVVTRLGTNPLFLYLLDRKGWCISLPENKKKQIKIFKALEKKGAKFYFFEYDANYNNLHNKDYKTNIKFKMFPIKTYINKLQDNSIPKMYLAKPKY